MPPSPPGWPGGWGCRLPEVLPVGVPPEEAIRFFAAKGRRATFDWPEMLHEEHAADFTVAKMGELDLLDATHRAVRDALAKGRTFEQFRQELEPTLRAAGWWGRQERTDPLTGERRMVQLGSTRRLQIIYDTNLRTAYAAGQWERIERVKAARPWLRYVAVLDARTRPLHRAWHGTILPVDHPWWRTHYPPPQWLALPVRRPAALRPRPGAVGLAAVGGGARRRSAAALDQPAHR